MIVDITPETLHEMVTEYMGIAEKYFPDMLSVEQIDFIVKSRPFNAAEFLSDRLTSEQIDFIVKESPFSVRFMQDKLKREHVIYVMNKVSKENIEYVLGKNLIYQNLIKDKITSKHFIKKTSLPYIPKNIEQFGVLRAAN
jgi:hypothetical protein